jgi:hypothetical protein
VTPARRITDRPRQPMALTVAKIALLLMLAGVIVLAVGLLEGL